MEDLNTSLNQYREQLVMVNQALESVTDETERESLITLQSDLEQLVQLTQENMDSLESGNQSTDLPKEAPKEIDDEYALFMEEMAKSGAYEEDSKADITSVYPKNNEEDNNEDIEDELASMLGMKCAVYHMHKWGGQPTLHNAMVSSVVPREEDHQFKDLQVRVLFTHPTHTEMLPCPFFLSGECRFNDEQCRYSHGAIVPLSSLKEAIEPSFDALKIGSRILIKLKPPDDEDISLANKSTEKYHLWHRAVITSIDLDKRLCSVKLEHGVKSGEKRKAIAEEFNVRIEDMFPLTIEDDDESSSDGSLSDTEYPDNKSSRLETDGESLIADRTVQSNGAALGEWERHTRGIGSKLMLSMGYVPGAGLGAAGEGRVAPVEARLLPVGKSLDHCMAISERNAQDPMKVEQRLQRLQKKEEERNKRAYEREKERERRNVFNFINRTLGDDSESVPSTSINVRESTSKDLNIEQFKITEDVKKLERDVLKLNTSMGKYPLGTPGYRSIALQIAEKNKELDSLRRREQQITREQTQRKDKLKMTVF